MTQGVNKSACELFETILCVDREMYRLPFNHFHDAVGSYCRIALGCNEMSGHLYDNRCKKRKIKKRERD